MSETWESVSFKDLIIERKDKFEPNSPEIEGLTKIEKIDFAEGRLHLGEYEPTKTQQIIVQPGDFVFSGLNIEKGAVAFNETGQRLVVSANYSTCQYDDRKVSLDFFKHYMRSANFQRLLKDNLKKDYGFTRPKHLLPLTFPVPKSKEEQSSIVRQFERSKNTLTQVAQELAHQEDLVAKLKQAILQEAITGRLTAGWRAAQTDVEPASQLLARIRAEKALLVAAKKLRPEKLLPSIADSEIPFALPEGWEWCRLGNILNFSSGDGLTSAEMAGGEIPVFGGNGINGYHDKANIDAVTIVVGRVGANCGAVHKTPAKAWVTDNAFITTFSENLLVMDFLVLLLRFLDLNHLSYDGSQPVISGKRVYPLPTPLPPLREQTEIVSRVEGLMERCRELEAEIERSRAHAAALLQAVLREAFAPATSDAA